VWVVWVCWRGRDTTNAPLAHPALAFLFGYQAQLGGGAATTPKKKGLPHLSQAKTPDRGHGILQPTCGEAHKGQCRSGKW